MSSSRSRQVIQESRTSRTPSLPPTSAAPKTPTILPTPPSRMSEKIDSGKTFFGGTRFRISAIVPVIFTTVAFALTIVIIVAGSNQGQVAGGYEVMSLNLSTLGQNVIKFSPATSTGTSASTNPAQQGITSIGDFFGDILNNITAGIDGSINNAEAQLVNQLTDSLGIQDSYSFYLTQMCMGTSENGASAGCTTYDAAATGLTNFTNIIQSSVVIGTTNISVPILGGLSSAGGYLTTITTSLTTAVFAFYILSAITSGLVAVLSAALIIHSGAKFSKILIYTTIVFAGLGITFHLVASIGVTVVISLANTVVNAVGNDLGLYSKVGNEFLALTWISFVLIFVAGGYWGAVWFVELRTYAVKARYRTIQEIGDYRGIFSEVIDDFRRPKDQKIKGTPAHLESLAHSRNQSENLDASTERWV